MIIRINYPPDKQKAIEAINNLPDGSKWEVIIRKPKSFRSLPQNKLYWLWLNCISDETRNDKNDLHDFFKDKFLPTKEIKIKNICRIVSMSTTELSTAQFKNYLDHIQEFSQIFLKITLTNPDDLHFLDFYEKYKEFI